MMLLQRCILLSLALSLLGGCFHAQLNGSVSGASISVVELRNPGVTVASAESFDETDSSTILGEEKWNSLNALLQQWWLGIFQLNPNAIDENTLYLVTASGGFDHDMDRDLRADDSPTALSASWRAIVPGEVLLGQGEKVSALTEAAYRWIAPQIDELDDNELLQALDVAAATVVTDISKDGSSGYEDLLNWTRLFSAEASFKRDIALLNSFSDALISGASEATLDNLANSIMEGVAADDYDAEYWRALSAELDDRSFATENFLYASIPDSNFCIEGELTDGARDRALESLNQIRALHDLAPVSYSNLYDADVQEGALIQAANNFLDHFPDTGSLCFTEGGASASGNLSGSSRLEDPAFDMIGWVDDSANVSVVAAAGHRRWIIDPFLTYTSYGQVDGFSVQKVIDFDQEPTVTADVDVDYVAFPYRTYPYLFFSTNEARPTPWSFSVIENQTSRFGNQHGYFVNATIEVTRLSDGASMTVTDEYSDTSGFGVPNFLSWNVEAWEFDTPYQVTIRDVAMQSGQVKDFSYQVFIDYADLVDLNEPLEAGDSVSGNTISGTLFDGDDEDSYTLELSGNITFEGDSQFSNQAFFILVYGADEQLIQASDDSFTLTNLDPGEYTVVISNCAEPGCYTGFKNYTVTFD